MQLSKKQVDFLTHSFKDINLLSGSIRSGKTFIQIYRWLYFLEAEAVNNVDCLISGKKADAVERNIVFPMLDIIEQEGLSEQFVYNRSPRRLIYLPKNIIQYIEGANDEGAEPRIRGMTIQAWLGDEVTLYPKSFFMQAIGRCSAGKRYKFLTCNPDSPSHYIRENIIDKIANNETNGKVWYFNLEDNPGLDRGYVDQIKKLYTGVFYERFIEGKWVLAEGVVYNLFNRKEHIITEYPIDEIDEYVLGIDWGYEHPLAINLFAVDYDGIYYLIDEIYETHQLIDNSLLVLMKNRGWFDKMRGTIKMPISYAYADSNRPDYIYTFNQLTSVPTLPADKEVNEGIQSVQRKLVKKGNDRYGFYVMEHCTNTIKEFESYRWKTNREGQGRDEVVKENDHSLDSTRMVIFTRERNQVKSLSKDPFKL